MNLTINLCKICGLREQLLKRPLVLKRCDRTLFGFGKKSKSSEESKELVPTSEIEEESKVELSNEEIMKMRDKSRLPPLVRSRQTLQNILPIQWLWQMQTTNIKKRYAMFGKASGLKPGVMWPSKQELEYMKGYEKAFEQPFHVMVEEVKNNRDKQLERRRVRKEEILEKLKELPKLKKEFWSKYKQMHLAVEEEKAKKEKMIQEVKEFVGYDLDPKDPRFEEAMLKRDEENKKLLKAQRKQEKQRLALARLKELSDEAMEREKEEQKILDKSKTKTVDKSDENKS